MTPVHHPLDALTLADPDAPPHVMGVLNITPDSFSDGGRFLARDVALSHALSMVEQGASLIDIGGESSRPGAAAVSTAEQMDRVLPVLECLRPLLPPEVVLSADTRDPLVAAAAVKAGATLINDISGGSAPGMLETAAEHNAGVVLMHMQGTPETMQQAPTYEDVVGEVLAYLQVRAAAARAVGIPAHRILIDPGIGFGKTRVHNLALLRALPRFVATGYPVLLGTSRKRFMGAICRETVFSELVGATCGTTALGVTAGVKVFRVHDVRANRQAMEVAWAIAREG
ncbi:MAG: dihydropteroate synthase [Gammaproteobacteria bacterium]|nr:dihydropteroate synthase [Gammaproteobacteria bacterium]